MVMFSLVTDCKGNLFLQKYPFWPQLDLRSPTDCAQMFSAWCHEKRNIKKTEKWVSGRCGVMLDTVTSSDPIVWVSTDCTTQTQFPSQVGCRL